MLPPEHCPSVFNEAAFSSSFPQRLTHPTETRAFVINEVEAPEDWFNSGGGLLGMVVRHARNQVMSNVRVPDVMV